MTFATIHMRTSTPLTSASAFSIIEHDGTFRRRTLRIAARRLGARLVTEAARKRQAGRRLRFLGHEMAVPPKWMFLVPEKLCKEWARIFMIETEPKSTNTFKAAPSTRGHVGKGGGESERLVSESRRSMAVTEVYFKSGSLDTAAMWGNCGVKKITSNRAEGRKNSSTVHTVVCEEGSSWLETIDYVGQSWWVTSYGVGGWGARLTPASISRFMQKPVSLAKALRMPIIILTLAFSRFRRLAERCQIFSCFTIFGKRHRWQLSPKRQSPRS